jgi:hypothetical protein
MKGNTTRRSVWFAIVALMASLAQAAPPARVGDIGDLNQMELQGAKAISSSDIRHALLNDSEFQLASTPTAPLEAFLQTTKTELELGYLRAGFPQAKVDLSVNPSTRLLVVKVNEVPRLIAEKIEITGTKQVDAKRLEAYILRGSEPGRFPLQLVDGGAGTPDGPGQAIIGALVHMYCQFLPAGTPETRLAASKAMRKLVAPAMHAIADYLVEPESDFYIPVDPASMAKNSAGQWGVVIAAVPWIDHLATRGSWPWTLSRESVLLIAGRAKYTDFEAGRLMKSPDLGPVGCLAISRAYLAANSPVTARVFAKRGLELLTLEHFESDCKTLFAGHTPQAMFCSAMMKSLRDLSDQELISLELVTGKKLAGTLRVLVKFAREAPPDSPDVFPPALQKAVWEGGVKDLLESALKTLAESK